MSYGNQVATRWPPVLSLGESENSVVSSLLSNFYFDYMHNIYAIVCNSVIEVELSLKKENLLILVLNSVIVIIFNFCGRSE